jgi:hypothetical protein
MDHNLLHFHIVKMYKDKELKMSLIFFVNVWRKNIFDIYVTEYGTALTNILPILFLLHVSVSFFHLLNKGNTKIIELRTILQRESPHS